MTGRSRSTDRKLRVKAKKSPGGAPWGHNDDNKNTGQGEEERPTRVGRCRIK